MSRFHLFCSVLGIAVGLSMGAPAAFAQSSPSGAMKAPPLQPQGDGDTPMPAAIPGVGDQGLQTQQSVAKQQSGDPTAELFTAINGDDYNSAQDAISRGADLNAQNSLGESPIDLSVALNRNNITFMLLAARNDSGDDSTPASASFAPATAMPSPHHIRPGKSSAVAVKLIENPNAAPGNDPGIPNASAGFLGFNH